MVGGRYVSLQTSLMLRFPKERSAIDASDVEIVKYFIGGKVDSNLEGS